MRILQSDEACPPFTSPVESQPQVLASAENKMAIRQEVLRVEQGDCC